jgi:hypothetical protein
MKAWFDPKPFHVGLLADKVALGPVLRREIKKNCKCCLNIHKTKLWAEKCNKCRSGLQKNFIKPNQIKIRNKENYTIKQSEQIR